MSSMNPAFAYPPSIIDTQFWKFFICGTPKASHLDAFLSELNKHHIKHVVRLSYDMYSTDTLVPAGIQFHDWPIPDGAAPQKEKLLEWYSLLESLASKDESQKQMIAVHCSAGLGRAPEFVCCALVEFGMPNQEALTLVRKHRKDALNSYQVDYVLKYKPLQKRKLKLKKDSDGPCTIV